MKSRFSPRILVSALILALGVGGTAFAMNPERCGAAGGRMEQRMAYGMKEMSRLHDDLKLDVKQETLWQEADKASRASMGEMRDKRRQQHADMLAAVSQPGADLRAVLKQMDEQREVGRKQHEVNRDRWLAVYDSLDAAQKEKARLFFKGRIEHMGQGGRFGPGGPARN